MSLLLPFFHSCMVFLHNDTFPLNVIIIPSFIATMYHHTATWLLMGLLCQGKFGKMILYWLPKALLFYTLLMDRILNVPRNCDGWLNRMGNTKNVVIYLSLFKYFVAVVVAVFVVLSMNVNYPHTYWVNKISEIKT